MRKTLKMIETLANGYSSESTQRELSNEYQHDRVLMVFKKFCVLVLWMKVASALEGLSISCMKFFLKTKSIIKYHDPCLPNRLFDSATEKFDKTNLSCFCTLLIESIMSTQSPVPHQDNHCPILPPHSPVTLEDMDSKTPFSFNVSQGNLHAAKKSSHINECTNTVGRLWFSCLYNNSIFGCFLLTEYQHELMSFVPLLFLCI